MSENYETLGELILRTSGNVLSAYWVFREDPKKEPHFLGSIHSILMVNNPKFQDQFANLLIEGLKTSLEHVFDESINLQRGTTTSFTQEH